MGEVADALRDGQEVTEACKDPVWLVKQIKALSADVATLKTQLAALSARDLVDEQEIARQVLAALTPAAIADAVLGGCPMSWPGRWSTSSASVWPPYARADMGLIKVAAIVAALAAGAGGLAYLLRGTWRLVRGLVRLADVLGGRPPQFDGDPDARPGLIEHLASLDHRLGAVGAQLTPNGGTSLADAVNRIEAATGATNSPTQPGRTTHLSSPLPGPSR
jgi:hypothetical protein